MEKIAHETQLVSRESQEQADLLMRTHGVEKEQPAFVDYLDPDIPLDERLAQAYDELGVPDEQRDEAAAYLDLLDVKHKETLYHSIRVGLTAKGIAHHEHMDEKTLFFSGIFHDIGKSLVRSSTLEKTKGWTDLDTQEMAKHVAYGRDLVNGVSRVIAEIVEGHHQFQVNPYPAKLSEFPADYSDEQKQRIEKARRILALADVYDALHRVNEKYDDMQTLTGEKVKEKMLRMNPDQVELIEELYNAGIFTTKTYPRKHIN